MPVCKFFLAKSGCARGEACRFQHQPESQTHIEGALQSLKLDSQRRESDLPSSSILLTTPRIDKHTTSAEFTCLYFQKGACKYGDQCHFQHNTIGPEGLNTSPTANIVCRFFQRGTCTKGERCQFSHDVRLVREEASRNTQISDESHALEVDNDRSMPEPPIAGSLESNVRSFGGALVTFGPGGAVIKVEPALNSSSRLQMCNTVCTWYAPSKIATLQFTSSQQMERAAVKLARTPILSRLPSCKTAIDKKHKPWRCLVKVGNLDVSTTSEMLEVACTMKPQNTVMGDSSYSSSTEEIGQSVHRLLTTIGIIESWTIIPISNTARIKATATFSTKEEAAKAVRDFNGYLLPQLGGSKVFMSHLLKSKYSVLTLLHSKISSELDKVQQSLHVTGYLEIKTYPPSEKSGRFTVLHVISDTAEKVGKAKAAVEKILAGHTAKGSRSLIWHDFFLKPEGTALINQLGKQYNVFIYRDAKRFQLKLYGDEEDRAIAESALLQAVDDLSLSGSELKLDDRIPEALQQMTYRKIVKRLGKNAVRLNVIASPRIITVHGSSGDTDWVRSILQEALTQTALPASDAEDEKICAVCWCDTTETYMTPCGHLYDKECFLGQCLSAEETGFPIKCLGASGNCQAVIPFTELEYILSTSQLDEVLEISFTNFVRKHPSEYQYCPTADCDHVYRRTTDAEVHMCSTCLTSICTACGAISHEGLTCRENKMVAISDDAFQKWKKDNGAKDCPKCGSTIQKSEGCNHMTCRTCTAHLCWICLSVFGSGQETYDHLVADHGGIFEAEYRGF